MRDDPDKSSSNNQQGGRDSEDGVDANQGVSLLGIKRGLVTNSYRGRRSKSGRTVRQDGTGCYSRGQQQQHRRLRYQSLRCRVSRERLLVWRALVCSLEPYISD